IERGKYNPSLELAFQLAEFFGMSIEEIFVYKKAAEPLCIPIEQSNQNGGSNHI
ncbi:MAG: helix-turn-helix domain-containing protein, partial [Clostridia bacterium]|nr:helix-turn-helix domain-containing protein [Clostridia bacterium]